jgi:C-methyltransferase
VTIGDIETAVDGPDVAFGCIGVDGWRGSVLWFAAAPGHWSLLVDSVRTGRPSVPTLRGQEFFDYLAGEPDLARLFDQVMTSVSELAVGPIVAGYDFSGYSTIVDVGGGHGRLLAAILAATPAAQGVLYDQPQVVADAPTLLQEHGIDARVRIERGSFFETVPAGGDLYVLKLIIQDWPDEQAVTILRNVRLSLQPRQAKPS